VEQVSLPYRIALGALLVVAALWFTVLKPQPAPAPAPLAPGVAGLANATKAAKGAAAVSAEANARAAATDGQSPAPTSAKKASSQTTNKTDAASRKATGHPAVAKTVHHRVLPRKTAPGAATKPSPTLLKADGTKDRSIPLLADLNRGRTLVLLFWNKKGADDRAVRSALKGVGRHHGKVVVRSIPAQDVGDYEAITRGAQVLQSPTVLVIGKDKKAHPIVGFTYTGEIDQLVSDVLAGRTP
jgi:hypothetical protein